ncbi:hypothetical protein [Chloroflexus sp. Y-396-1]|uniref:hypothetical protein n=1 Tax=Chloroflexus sp. Y-396-1 TaxID=867845 RepID=UPI0004900812|nr:hypothetical protein [Chloroflexus sp. Y-396-1]
MTERFTNGAIPTNITHPLPMTPDLGDHLDAQAVGPRLALAAMEPTTIASTHDADGFGTRPYQRGDGNHRRTNEETLHAQRTNWGIAPFSSHLPGRRKR